jgi:elongation factor G
VIAGITSKSPLFGAGFFVLRHTLLMPSAIPILWMPIFAVTSEDRRRLPEALAAIGRDDPAVLVRGLPESEELLYGGTSVDHLTQTFRRIFHEMQIPSWTGQLRVRYVETIGASAEAEGKYIRQTGGSGNYGHVKLRIEPGPSDSGIAFSSAVEAAIVVPSEYLAPIEEGIREAARGGVLAGYEMTGFRATLFDGSWHEADSNPMAFRIAASLALKEAARKATPVVLEPMMSTVFTVPESKLGAQVAEVSALGGRIEQISSARGIAVVGAVIPLRTLLERGDSEARLTVFSSYERINWPPGNGDAYANMRQPHPLGPRNDSATAADPDFDWT